MVGIKTKAMPPIPPGFNPKFKHTVMMQKMQLAREAELLRAEGSKLAAANKAKGEGFLETR